MRGILRVSLFEVYNTVVYRGLGQAYEKMNLAVGEKNCLDDSGGKKQLVCPFRRHEFWKCIGCIL